MLRRVFAQPIEQMLALGSFCGGGVLARHPKLRVAFLEANCSWLPWLLWRLDEAWELDGDVFAPDLKMKPSEYFKRHCVVSIEPDELIANNVIATNRQRQSGFFHRLPARRFPISRRRSIIFSDCRSPKRTNAKFSGITARHITRCKIAAASFVTRTVAESAQSNGCALSPSAYRVNSAKHFALSSGYRRRDSQLRLGMTSAMQCRRAVERSRGRTSDARP